MALNRREVDLRGNSSDRRRRKEWVLIEFGDGDTCVCSFEGCDEVLTFDTLTIDRYPVPGCEGGRYVRGNIRPACSLCNSTDGGLMGYQRSIGSSAKSMVS